MYHNNHPQISLLTLPRSISHFHTTSQFLNFFFKKITYTVQLVLCMYSTGIRSFSGHGQPTAGHHLKWNWLLNFKQSPFQMLLTVNSSSGVSGREWGMKYCVSCCNIDCFDITPASLGSGSYSLSAYSSAMIPKPVRKGCDVDGPFVDESFTDTDAPHFYQS